jgi:integrase
LSGGGAGFDQLLNRGLPPVDLLLGELKWGVDPARLIGSNPIARLKPLRYDNPKQGRALTEDEVGRLLEQSMPHWRSI